MKFLKLIPLIGAVADLIGRFVNKPKGEPSVSAKEAKAKWENDKRSF